uniref:Uncharacterized protein n=1 Tax=Panagrolaimus superbus TaxID=310955 RepID=A0A914Y1Y1_9BILA
MAWKHTFVNLILFLFVVNLVNDVVLSASCNSNEYCPLGWSVKRKNDSSTQTCVPHSETDKCPKPYMCVASKCGINFCCISDKMLARLEEMEDEKEEPDDEENEEL